MTARLLALGLAVLLTACATGSVIVTGDRRPPTNPSQIKIVFQIPPDSNVIGMIKAQSLLGIGGQTEMDIALQELREQAASLGANTIVLTQTTEKSQPWYSFTPTEKGGTFSSGTNEYEYLQGVAVFVPDR